MNLQARPVPTARALFAALAALLAIVLPPSTAAAAPAQPTNFHTNAVGQTQVALAWTRTIGAESYVLYRNNVQIGVIEGTKANYLDTGLGNNTTYVYTLAVRDSTGDSTKTGLIAKTVTTVTNLTSCSPTPLPSGHYALDRNLTNPYSTTRNQPCLTFASGSNVSLDCRNHSITNAAKAYPTLVKIENLNGFLIYNCDLNRVPVDPVVDDALEVLSSTNGTIEKLDVTGPGPTNTRVAADHTDRIAWNNDTFTNAQIDSQMSTNNYIGNSSFTNPGGVSGNANVLLVGADRDVVAGNQIDGGPSAAMDDGIATTNGTHLLIHDNHIAHVFDLGIEGSNTLSDSSIHHNVVSYASFGGIGGWYGINFNNNKVWYNQIDHSGPAFQYFALPVPGVPTYSFSGNSFLGNTFTNPLNPSNTSAYFGFVGADPPFTPSNNSFFGNNFGKTSAAPVVKPTSLIMSAGSNICTLPSPDLPCT